MSLNVMLQPWLLLSLVFVSVIPIYHCQLVSAPESPIQPPPAAPEQQAPPASTSSSSKGKIAKAVAGTAAGTFVVSGLLYFLIHRYLRARRKKEVANSSSAGVRRVVPQVDDQFERIEGNLRGLIIDENGLDVIYWKKLEENSEKGLRKEVLNRAQKNEQELEDEDGDGDDIEKGNQRKKSEPVHEIPLLRGKSSTSHIAILPEENEANRVKRRTPPAPPPASAVAAPKDVGKLDSPAQPFTPPPPPSSPFTSSANAKQKNPATPPPPPSISVRKSPAPPSPPPPASPVVASLRPSSKPAPTPYEMPAKNKEHKTPSGEDVSESGNDQVKLKPLHWDKANTNGDHSMVWDKIDGGSVRFDQDLMVAMFGTVAINRISPKGKSNTTSPTRDVSAPSGKTFLLDPRKSQNIAIVLISLAVSREEILDALKQGQGLNADTLEKLSRVIPTEEEQSQILAYKGDPSSLAAAEAFLYDILKAVPSAFKRLNAMLFRLNYDSEILQIKESLQTLELGCKELRKKGIFDRLLEAVLKAGNHMNAGTSRGNAQAFNLTSLRNLSDVKSTDGQTTLLYFVVEEVVRYEGKRCVLNRNRSLNRSSSSSRNSNGGSNFENSASSEQREKEYITLGLPIVGGLSSEFSNVKKASLIDYNSLVGSISALSARIVEIRKIVSKCRNDREGKFVKEMEHFLENAEEELKLLRDEQTRIVQLVKKTTEYYQGGASKEMAENPIQLFVLVKDFLGMVDQACFEIARNLQKRKKTKPSSS